MTTPPPSINIGGGSDDGGAEPSDGGGDTSDDGGDSTVAAPDIPAPDPADYPGMDQNTPEGAEQAFKYYIAVYFWARHSGDDSELRSLESQDCSSCTELDEEFQVLQENNEHWTPATITDVTSNLHKSENFDHEVGYAFKVSEFSVVNKSTKEVTEYEESEWITVGGMQWDGESWIVGGISAEWGDDVHPE